MNFKKNIVSIFLISIIVFSSGFIGIGKFRYNLTSKNIKLVQTSEMERKRVRPYTFLLDDGRVVIAGGDEYRNNRDGIITVEIYDPKTNKSKLIGQFLGKRFQRRDYTINLLNGNKLLLCGGEYIGKKSDKVVIGKSNENEIYDYPGANAEIFDINTGKSRFISNMNHPREWHLAVTLKDGKVLIIGGVSNTANTKTGFGLTKTTEIFDPATEKFTLAADMFDGSKRSAILMNDGNVFIWAGEAAPGFKDKHKLYDVKNNRFIKLPASNIARDKPDLIKLQNGDIAIIGGDIRGPKNLKNRVEVYDHKNNIFYIVKPDQPKGMLSAKFEYQKGILTSNNNILIMGGLLKSLTLCPPTDFITIFNPVEKTIKSFGKLAYKSTAFSVITLKDKKIALFGGGGKNNYKLIQVYKIKENY